MLQRHPDIASKKDNELFYSLL